MDNARAHTAVEALRWGKAQIERYGWIQAGYGHRSQGFCAVGALLSTSSILFSAAGDVFDAEWLLARAIGEQGDIVKRIVRFNDKPGTTKEMVLAKFDEAIALGEQLAGQPILAREEDLAVAGD